VRSSWFDVFVRSRRDAVPGTTPDRSSCCCDGGASRHATPEDLDRALAIPYRVTLTAGSDDAYYYLARLEATTLNQSDLDELTRWLRGDVGPAVSERGNVGDALARGAQRTLLRLAGLPRLTLEGRSGRFRSTR
jgi:hypothetical protein